MPRPKPNTLRSSHRIWLIAAGVLIALVAIPLLKPSTPSREAHHETSHTSDGAIVPEPSKTQRPTKDTRKEEPPAFPSRTWIVPADFDVLLAKHGYKRDPFSAVRCSR